MFREEETVRQTALELRTETETQPEFKSEKDSLI